MYFFILFKYFTKKSELEEILEKIKERLDAKQTSL
jgi:hypothetical protein